MGTVVVRYYPRRTEVLILSTNQRMACVARTCWHPFRGLSNPTEEYCEISTAQYGSIRIPPTFGGFNATRAAPLHTEPTCTHRWKCAITYQFSPVPYRPVPVLDWFIPYRPSPVLGRTLQTSSRPLESSPWLCTLMVSSLLMAPRFTSRKNGGS